MNTQEPAGDCREELLALRQRVADLERVEQALRESEAKYRRLHEAMRDAFACVDMDGRITEFNAAFAELTGYSSEEIPRLDYRDITPEKWHAGEQQIINEQVFKRGYSDVYEKEYIHKDGTVFPVELRSVLLRDESGQPTGALAIVRDITERKQAAQKLRESYDLLDSWMANMPSVAFIKDLEGRVTFVNRAFEDLFDLAPGEMLGKTDYDLYPTSRETAERMRANDRQVLEAGTPLALDETVIVDGRPRHFTTVKFPLRDKDGRITSVAGIATDITERKEAEAERERLLRDLQERVKELGCIYGVAELAHTDTSLAEICGQAVELLPSGWQYPEITRCRIRLHGREYSSEPFEETQWKLSAEITVMGCPRGLIEVFYLEQRPELHEGPFLVEERQLIDNIARTLGEAIRRKEAEQEAKRLQELSEFILGATNTGIDIIDSEFNIRYINPEWQQHYGDPTGRKCYAYFMDRSEVCPGCGIVEAMKTKQPTVTEEVLLREGNRPIQVTTIPFQDENGEGLRRGLAGSGRVPVVG